MPMPIRPTQEFDGVSVNYFPLNMDGLQTDLLTNASLKKTALASDGDADILFYIWKNSSVANNENDIEKKIYRISKDVNPQDLLKLKASGLIVGSDQEIRFTSRAANIIKTMVLGEQNSFEKCSIKKPYSIILAEQKTPKRKSALALASKMIDSINDNVVKTATHQPHLQSFKNKECYLNERIMSIGVASSTSAKEYNVRIYKNDKGSYEVWVFYGRIGGKMVAEVIGSYPIFDRAVIGANEIVSNKKNGKSRYKSASFYNYPSFNTDIPASLPSKSKEKEHNGVDPTTKSEIPSEIEKDKISKENNKYLDRQKVEQWLKEINENNHKHLNEFISIKNLPLDVLESYVQNNFFKRINFEWLLELMKKKDLNPKTLEILSHTRDQYPLFECITELENKLLDRVVTGDEPWALKILIANPPKELSEIKNENLRDKYLEYLLGRDSTNESEQDDLVNFKDSSIIFNLKKYSKKDKAKQPVAAKTNLSTEQSVVPEQSAIQLIEQQIINNGTVLKTNLHDLQTLLNSGLSLNEKTLEIISRMKQDLINKYGGHKDIIEEMIIQEDLVNIENKLLDRVVTGDEPWALKILIANPPKELSEIKNENLRDKYLEYLLGRPESEERGNTEENQLNDKQSTGDQKTNKENDLEDVANDLDLEDVVNDETISPDIHGTN